MSDDQQWYYAEGSEQKGPFSAVQMQGFIAAGTVRADTLVWTSSMPDWLPLSQTELFDAGAIPPAPPPGVAGGTAGAAPPRGFGEAVSVCFRNYVTFAGRASRSEFWYFALFNFVVSFVLNIVDVAIFGMETQVGMLSALWSLAVLLPGIAVGARRLHDTDRTGWWQLIVFVPLVGFIVLIVFFCLRPTPGRNRFG